MEGFGTGSVVQKIILISECMISREQTIPQKKPETDSPYQASFYSIDILPAHHLNLFLSPTDISDPQKGG